MFNIGGGELIVILLIALIVLGPQRLPDAARQVGKTMSELRRLSTGFQNEVRGALEVPVDPQPPARATDRAVEAVSAQGSGRPKRRTPLVADPDPGEGVPKAGRPRTTG